MSTAQRISRPSFCRLTRAAVCLTLSLCAACVGGLTSGGELSGGDGTQSSGMGAGAGNTPGTESPSSVAGDGNEGFGASPGESEPTNANAPADSNVADANGKATLGVAVSGNVVDFVRRRGSQLYVGDKPYRFAGCNIYWLAGSPKQQIREALATAKAMGATMVRANSLGTFLGAPGRLEPKLNVFDQNAFATIDYAISVAAKYGIRLQIALTDNYDYDGEGKYVFLRWRNLSNGNLFYTNNQVINDFKAYIKNLICHVNTITGLRYRDDPTIAIWETGNEFGAWMFKEGVPPVSFTTTIADYIKSLDQNHLIMDGSDGINNAALNIKNVDIYSNHFYPRSTSLYKSDEDAVIGADKVYVIGEWDWTGKSGGPDLASFLSTIENGKVAGDMWWSLFVRDAQCKSYVPHNDGYTIHWPGDNADMVTRAEQLRQHAYKMAGQTAPEKPTVPCPTPEP